MSNSPWGRIQSSITLLRGIRNVSTEGHGGLMITKAFAEKHLSDSAKKRALRYSHYYCYEEDCDWAIPVLELKDRWLDMKGLNLIDLKESTLRTLSKYHPDYLLERGITPIEPFYSEYLENQLRDKLLAEKSPNLIVDAWGEWKGKVPDDFLVKTADEKYYLVDGDSFISLNQKKIKYLSDCKNVRDVSP